MIIAAGADRLSELVKSFSGNGCRLTHNSEVIGRGADRVQIADNPSTWITSEWRKIREEPGHKHESLVFTIWDVQPSSRTYTRDSPARVNRAEMMLIESTARASGGAARPS
jgi:hypothetical protein